MMVRKLPSCYISSGQIACITWLLMAVILLYLMKQPVHISNPADPAVEYRSRTLMAFPYIVTLSHSSAKYPQIAAQPSHTEKMEPATMSSSAVIQLNNGSSDSIQRQQAVATSKLVMRPNANFDPGAVLALPFALLRPLIVGSAAGAGTRLLLGWYLLEHTSIRDLCYQARNSSTLIELWSMPPSWRFL